MSRHFIIILSFLLIAQSMWSQAADPGVGGVISPSVIEVGQTATLTIDFLNTGFDPIPAQSIELTISSSDQFYEMVGQPSGAGGALFNWVYLGSDIWRGTNSNAVPAFGGGDVIVTFEGTNVSTIPRASNVNVQVVSNFAMFNNEPSNDNYQPELQVIAATCSAGVTPPFLTSTGAALPCNGSGINLNSYHGGNAPNGTSLVWSMDGNPNDGVSSVINPMIFSTGSYYAYYYDSVVDCYSPASNRLLVSMSSCNQNPVAANDNVVANFNTPITIDILNNDFDPDNDNISIVSVNTSSQGASPIVSGGSIVYTPPTGFTGIDQFSYTICDNGSPSQCDNATVTVQVNSVLTFQNQCPDLYVDIADIHEGPIPAGNQLIWSTDDDPSDGISPVLGSRIYNSTTVYVYYFDPIGGCYSPGIEANIEVNSCNDAPIALNDSNSGEEDETQVGNVGINDNDPNNDNLSFTLIDDVDNGTLTLNPDGSYSYTPDIEFTGTDQFTYRVCDDGVPQLCDIATVTLTVTVVDFVCVDINAKVLLEGMIISPGGDLTYLQEMRTDMNDLRLLPGQSFSNGFAGGVTYSPKGQPYNVRPWLYNGNEGDFYDSQANANNGDAGYPNSVVDWVLVSLRENENDEPTSVVCQEAVLLHKDGTLEMVTPCCGVDRRKEYFIVIEHRNHLLVMSPQKVDMTRIGTQSDQVKYSVYHDFSLNNSYQTVDPNFNTEIGFGQKQIPDGRWVMIGGNGEQKFTHDDTDLTVDDEVIWGDQNSNVSLYLIGDFNMNGDINFNDRVLWEENNGLFSSVPRDKNQ